MGDCWGRWGLPSEGMPLKCGFCKACSQTSRLLALFHSQMGPSILGVQVHRIPVGLQLLYMILVTATLRRSRSWTFSEHLPDEAPERPNSSSTDEEGEPPVAWPDTDDEDSSFQSYWKNCDSTVCSTLQGSPTCSEPDIDAPLVNDTPVAATSPMSPFMGASPSFKLDTYTASPVSPDASPVGAPVARTGSDGAVTTLMLRRLG
eukprot:g6430.t1